MFVVKLTELVAVSFKCFTQQQAGKLCKQVVFSTKIAAAAAAVFYAAVAATITL